LALLWAVLLGYQRHVVEIHSGDGVFRLVSHRSPFEIYTKADDFAKPVEGGIFAVTNSDLKGTHVEAAAYDWATVVTTQQRVFLPEGMVNYEFYINGIPFSLTRSELRSGELRWQAPPGQTEEINVDVLSPPKAAPFEVRTP
jgi:hypothetical protein